MVDKVEVSEERAFWHVFVFNAASHLIVLLQYDPDARMIVVDVKKPKGERKSDLSQMAYYMEKDVRLKKYVYLSYE